MKVSVGHALLISIFFLIVSGCATHRAQTIVPTPMHQAQKEIPEDELLDVGISVFETVELTEKKAKKEGTHPDVRKAECHYIPYNLKNTLQESSYWGAVRIIPNETDGVDVMVKGEVLESNGEWLILKIDVIDSAGNTWIRKKYKAKATEDYYTGNAPGSRDAFQDLYNTVANDMAAYRNQLSSAEVQKIRMISRLEFAQAFSPDAFGDYLAVDNEGKATIKRLPADGDPQMERVLRVRERDNMYVDTLNEYYDGFYNEMWPAYEEWRRFNLKERTALREIKWASYKRMAGGALLMALAIAMDASDVQGTNAMQNIMIIGGGALVVDGINVSKQQEIHAAAIQELSDSFGRDMKPVVMEFEGNQYELTGSAEEQYLHWRELLRKIYFAETGFDQLDDSQADQTIEQENGVQSENPTNILPAGEGPAHSGEGGGEGYFWMNTN